jgi:hypothetical protein
MMRTLQAAAAICCGTLFTFGAAETHAASITFNNSSCAAFSVSGSNGNFTLNCDGGAVTPANVPSGCSVTANPNSLPVGGGTVQLTASCNGTAASGFSWSAPASGNANNSSLGSASITSTTTFSVTPSNANGAANAVTTTVSVAPPGNGGGGGGNNPENISCSGFSATHVLAMDWNSGQVPQGYSSQVGGFSDGEALVVKFTTPARSADNSLGKLSIVEFDSGGTVPRTATLSGTPCDFTQGLGLGSQSFGDVGPRFYFAVGAAPFYSVSLRPNTTYYVNVKNESASGARSCVQGVPCNIQFTLSKPSGL